MSTIKVGDRVRSFHFTSRDLNGERACYVEGVVMEITPPIEGCARYAIKVDRNIWGGVDHCEGYGGFVYPPINGTPRSLSDEPCNGVEKID